MRSFALTLSFSTILLMLLGIQVSNDSLLIHGKSFGKRIPASEPSGGSCRDSAASFLGRIPSIKQLYDRALKLPNWGRFDMEAFKKAKELYQKESNFERGAFSFNEKTPLPKTAEEYMAYMEVINQHNLADDVLSKVGEDGLVLPKIKDFKSDPYRIWRMKRAVKFLHGESFTGKLKNLLKLNKKLTSDDIENLFSRFYHYTYGARGTTPDIDRAAARIMVEKFATEGVAQLAKESLLFLDKPNFIYKFMSSGKGKNLMNWGVIFTFAAHFLPPPYIPKLKVLYKTNGELSEVYEKVIKVGWKNLEKSDQMKVINAWKTDLKTDRAIEVLAPYFAIVSMMYLIYAQADFIIEQDAEFDEQKEVIDRLAIKLGEILKMAKSLEEKGFKVYSDQGKLIERPSGICSMLTDCLNLHQALIKAGRKKLASECREWMDSDGLCGT